MPTVIVPPEREVNIQVHVKHLAECGQNGMFEPIVALHQKPESWSQEYWLITGEPVYRTHIQPERTSCVISRKNLYLIAQTIEVRPVSSSNQVLKNLRITEGELQGSAYSCVVQVIFKSFQ